jgi:4-hydroxythreonine-4-phosphate dehydrogenase
MSREGGEENPRPVGITLGDPAGVGPEILVKALAEAGVGDWERDFLIIGSEPPLRQAADRLGLPLACQKVSLPLESKLPHIALLEPQDMQFPEHLSPGRPGADSGWLSFKYLELGAALALEGKLHSLVTLPVSKSLIARKVPGFRGHTEYLQQKSGAQDVRMMLGTRTFRITLVTTHCPLSEVARNLTIRKVSDTIRITQRAMQALLAAKKAR